MPKVERPPDPASAEDIARLCAVDASTVRHVVSSLGLEEGQLFDVPTQERILRAILKVMRDRHGRGAPRAGRVLRELRSSDPMVVPVSPNDLAAIEIRRCRVLVMKAYDTCPSLASWYLEYFDREERRRFRMDHPGEPQYELDATARSELAESIDGADLVEDLEGTTPLELQPARLPLPDFTDAELGDALLFHEPIRRVFDRFREDSPGMALFTQHVHTSILVAAHQRLHERR